MSLDTIIKSIPSDALAFRGRTSRKEFCVKLAFWQLAFPATLFGLLAFLPSPDLASDHPAWFLPILLLVLSNLVFLAPVAVRRGRDAGIGGAISSGVLGAGVVAFIAWEISTVYWVVLATLAVFPSQKAG